MPPTGQEFSDRRRHAAAAWRIEGATVATVNIGWDGKSGFRHGCRQDGFVEAESGDDQRRHCGNTKGRAASEL